MSDTHFHNRGLTLLELMIVLAIAGILIASSAPSFSTSIQNTRMVTQVNGLHASINLARSEAIKRNENVTVCRSSDSTSCTGNWQDGWIVFVDLDDDGTVDDDGDETECEDGEDCVLRVYGVLSGGNSLTFSQANIIFGTDGIASSGATGTFTLCDSRGADKARGLIIGLSGRPRLATDDDDLECPS